MAPISTACRRGPTNAATLPTTESSSTARDTAATESAVKKANLAPFGYVLIAIAYIALAFVAALQHLSDVAWLETQNEQLMAYVKQYAGNAVICVVNLDAHHSQEGSVTIPAHLGLPPAYAVTDQLSGERFDWKSR